MYRRVKIIDGESVEPIQFVAVHPLRWPIDLEPQAAFVEADGVDAKLEAAEALAEIVEDFVADEYERILEFHRSTEKYILYLCRYCGAEGRDRDRLWHTYTCLYARAKAALHQYREGDNG